MRKVLILLLKIGLGVIGLVILLVVGLLAYVNSQKRQYSKIADTHDLSQRIDKLATEYTGKRNNAGLVVGLIQQGQRFIKGYGKINATESSPPGAATLFEIGSVTKTFTAVTLAEMTLQGKVRLTDPMTRYLPGEITNSQLREITLLHLATHTSGLPRLPDNFDEVSKNEVNPYANYRAADLYRYLNAAKPRAAPGKTSDYSNLGYGLLGHILELKAGKPYEQLIQQAICIPLGMTNTVIHLSDTQKKNLTPGHDVKGVAVPNWDFDVLAPAGAFRSNVEDLLKFIAANLETNGTPLSDALQESHKKRKEDWRGAIGLGWQIAETVEALKILWHNGGTGGYVSFVGFDPDHQTGVVILSNYGDAFAGDDALDQIGFDILKLASKVSLN